MADRILGPQGSKRRRRFLWVPMLTICAFALLFIGNAAGVSITSGFELDASVDLSNGSAPQAAITDNTANAIPDDWDRICHTFTITKDTGGLYPDQCSSAGDDHAIARSFDSETNADGTANNASIFTGGGSKDPLVLSGWNWKDASGGLPDKDNLLHAMAARYLIGSDSDVYFGADRFDNSGDSQIGFWFFRSPVCLNANGTFGTGSATACSGAAAHAVGTVPHDPNNPGDILILSDFTNGGAQPTIRVFEYVGSGGSDGALNLLGGNATDVRDCKVVSTNDFCASVNNFDGAAVPWLYKNKSGQTSFGHGEFYEGGLNLNFLGLQNECFSSFLAETRSSQSTTATLKDFVLGSFQQCGATMTTTPHASSTTIGADGSATISDDATITVSGGSSPPAPTGSVSFFYCYSATPITACSASGTSAGSVNLSGATKNGNDYTVNSGNITVHAAGTYCWFSSWPGDNNYHPLAGATVISHDGPDECVTIGPLQPALHTTQSATGEVTPGSNVHDTVVFDTAPATPSNGTFGTVTFKLYGPFTSSPTSCGSLTGSTVNTVTIDGTHTSYTSSNVAPTTPGWYAFTVSYAPASGDVNNLAVPETSCGATGEQFHVRQFNPTMTTAQTVVISDSATVLDGGGGGNLTGTVHFRAYSDSGCTAGNELTDQQDVAVSGASPVTVSTTASVTFNTAGAHAVYWKVSYTSTNPAQTDIAASCTENTSLTITN